MSRFSCASHTASAAFPVVSVAHLHYPHFRAQGLYDGSGLAEAACKTVVITRAKGAGMRLTPVDLDTLLPLCTATLNRTYKAFWQDRSVALS